MHAMHHWGRLHAKALADTLSNWSHIGACGVNMQAGGKHALHNFTTLWTQRVSIQPCWSMSKSWTAPPLRQTMKQRISVPTVVRNPFGTHFWLTHFRSLKCFWKTIRAAAIGCASGGFAAQQALYFVLPFGTRGLCICLSFGSKTSERQLPRGVENDFESLVCWVFVHGGDLSCPAKTRLFICGLYLRLVNMIWPAPGLIRILWLDLS